MKITYEQLKEIIVKEIPEKDFSYMGDEFECKITLEDVLMVLDDFVISDMDKHICYLQERNNENFTTWLLNKPLSEQSEETQKFILELIN